MQLSPQSLPANFSFNKIIQRSACGFRYFDYVFKIRQLGFRKMNGELRFFRSLHKAEDGSLRIELLLCTIWGKILCTLAHNLLQNRLDGHN